MPWRVLQRLLNTSIRTASHPSMVAEADSGLLHPCQAAAESVAEGPAYIGYNCAPMCSSGQAGAGVLNNKLQEQPHAKGQPVTSSRNAAAHTKPHKPMHNEDSEECHGMSREVWRLRLLRVRGRHLLARSVRPGPRDALRLSVPLSCHSPWSSLPQ